MVRKSRKTVPVPRASAGVAVYGRFVTEDDLRAILKAIGLPADETAIPSSAASLNDAAMAFILGTTVAASATDGEKAEWCGSLIERADALLACLDESEDGDDPLDAAGMVLRGPPGEFVRVEGLPIDPRDDLRAVADSLDRLLRRAILVRRAYDKRKGRARRPAVEEINFVRNLVAIYRQLTGKEPTLTATGPAVAFFGAIAVHLRPQAASVGSPRSNVLDAGFSRLAAPSSCLERLRGALSYDKKGAGKPV